MQRGDTMGVEESRLFAAFSVLDITNTLDANVHDRGNKKTFGVLWRKSMRWQVCMYHLHDIV